MNNRRAQRGAQNRKIYRSAENSQNVFLNNNIDKQYDLSYNNFVKPYDWNEKKNEQLKKERDVGFEDVIIAIEEGWVFEIIAHPNKKRYPNQQMYIVEILEYVYLVPFVEDEEKIFLKTIIPSRKATKRYLIKKQ